MNNKIEVIGIDHGWSNIKTAAHVFVTGVKEITTEPALFDGVLSYEGRFYKIGGIRQEVRATKIEDNTVLSVMCKLYLFLQAELSNKWCFV